MNLKASQKSLELSQVTLMELSHFSSRGRGRRGAVGREIGNGKETEF